MDAVERQAGLQPCSARALARGAWLCSWPVCWEQDAGGTTTLNPSQHPEHIPESAPDQSPEMTPEPERTEADVLEELEQRKREEGWTFEIRPLEGIDIGDGDLPAELGGYKPSENMDDLPPADPTSEDPLPDRFDWRDEGVIGPVRDQGCGDCWAFAACAVAESVHAIAGRPQLDLSEQCWWGCEETQRTPLKAAGPPRNGRPVLWSERQRFPCLRTRQSMANDVPAKTNVATIEV